MMFGPLAYVEKLAKRKRNVKNFLLAFDCLSSYFCVEPLKTKYATETSSALTNMIKNKQPQIVGVDDVTEFTWAFKMAQIVALREIFSPKKRAYWIWRHVSI